MVIPIKITILMVLQKIRYLFLNKLQQKKKINQNQMVQYNSKFRINRENRRRKKKCSTFFTKTSFRILPLACVLKRLNEA